MSRCRVAGSRALGLDLLNSSSRVYSRLPLCSLSRIRVLPAVANPVARVAIKTPHVHHRTFSTYPVHHHEATSRDIVDILPVFCPGCGALSQTVEPEEPGYYSKTRKQTRKLLRKEHAAQSTSAEENPPLDSCRDNESYNESPPVPLHGKPPFASLGALGP